MESEFDRIASWLSTPAAYPHAPARVERIETHISCVFLAGDEVYKLKKPVRFDFLDFSTLAAREHACREELRLNRRLAPQAYIDVVPVTQQADGTFQIGGDGSVIDWLVHMRRLPTDQTLDALYRRGELRPEQIDRLARTLVDFYRSLAPSPITRDEYRERAQTHVRGNRSELLALRHHLPQGMVERAHGFQLELLKLQPELFDERIRQGRIVDGHGDLRPEHICLTDPPAIFDCIEFNAEFRQLDVADELCFLAAECDFLGAEHIGPELLRTYQELSGDRPPPILLDFYKSYRACVRAKVAALREDQTTGQPHAAAASEAARHLELADRYTQRWLRPLVIVVGGLSGTGKSTLAVEVAEALGAALLRTDVIRRELFGEAGQSASIYSPESRQQVYREMFDRAKRRHAEGISIVLDGTFGSADSFQGAKQIVVHPRAVFLAVECVCPSQVARERIARRLVAGQDASEASPALHDQQRAAWQTWPAEAPQIQIDTRTELPAQAGLVLEELARRMN